MIAGYFHCRANKLKHTGYHLNRTAPSVSHVSSHRSCPDWQPAARSRCHACSSYLYGNTSVSTGYNTLFTLCFTLVFSPDQKTRTGEKTLDINTTNFFFKLTTRGSRKAACQRSQDTDVQLDLWAVQKGWKRTFSTVYTDVVWKDSVLFTELALLEN